MRIESPVFKSNHYIPVRFTADGDDISPPLVFKDIPTGTKSLVLIVEDPDAPEGVFDHWIGWNISPRVRSLAEGQKLEVEGVNSFGVGGYKGPSPPSGKSHRYYFKLFALNDVLDLPTHVSKEEVLMAMKDHVITKAQMIGLYRRRVIDKNLNLPGRDWQFSRLFKKT